MVCFKPLEIVDLVPLVGGREFRINLDIVSNSPFVNLSISNLGFLER